MKITIIAPTSRRATHIAAWLQRNHVPVTQRVMHREQLVCWPDETNFQHVEAVLDTLGKQHKHNTEHKNKQKEKPI